MPTNNLAERLRALHAARRPHFSPHNPDGTPRPEAFAIVATEERLQDLELAAQLVERVADLEQECRALEACRQELMAGLGVAP